MDYTNHQINQGVAALQAYLNQLGYGSYISQQQAIDVVKTILRAV